jgi:DNA polymerase-1
MDKKIVLIDGSSYVYRAFYALPPLISPSGEPTGAIYGFIRMISSLLKDLNPDYIAVAFDLPKKTFKQEKVKSYKATRKETPNELKVQIPKIKEILKLWGIPILEMEGYEADDIIATLSKKFSSNYKIIVVSPDKDMLQLVNQNITVFNPMQNIFYDIEKVKEKYGIFPNQFVDFQILVGDSVDNIKGIKGIGKKTAQKLLNEFGSIENIYRNLDKLKPKLKDSFLEAQDKIDENRYLLKLEDNIPLKIEIDDLKKKSTDIEKLKDVFERLGFKSLLKSIEKENLKTVKTKQKTLF